MSSPYAELFIYQLEGRLDPRTAIEAGSFLGHWQEGETAFLFFQPRRPAWWRTSSAGSRICA